MAVGAHVSVLLVLVAVVTRHVGKGLLILGVVGSHLTVVGLTLVVLLLVLVVVFLNDLEALLGLFERVIGLGLLALFCFKLLSDLALFQFLFPAAFESVKQIFGEPDVIELPAEGFDGGIDDSPVKSGCIQVNADFFDSPAYHIHLSELKLIKTIII